MEIIDMITLDTCSLVWLSLSPDRLSKNAKKAIKNNSLIMSDISLWEIAMLTKSGRLIIDTSYSEYIELLLSSFGIQVNPITPEIARMSVDFDDSVNRDPADRIIAATSLVEDAPLVTADKNLIKAKIINTIW
ncbi:MAG: type II toxin-antitoxin system VapC family toxin [Spirochaetales bacterium]|nr:type II toxin-antitoxin system VapC family toxin [Spirochaetales bacterium]